MFLFFLVVVVVVAMDVDADGDGSIGGRDGDVASAVLAAVLISPTCDTELLLGVRSR